MVLAAGVSGVAHAAINQHLARIALDLRRRLGEFIRWIKSPAAAPVSTADCQARYVLLKLRFNNLLDQLDIFADVLTQRGEHGTGTWLAGLDVLAEDALRLPAHLYDAPPLICFVQRGHGAAIRRARTRLPGGDDNPVGVIQIPRERMVGSGIAASLIHEVGHQGSELLGLTTTIRDELSRRYLGGTEAAARLPWELLSRWLNEILSDFWAVAHLGISATYGLMSVVSLPSYFVFRIGTDGPHPFPWIRVKISLALGAALYPHRQWTALGRQWEALYPPDKLPARKRDLLAALERVLPDFARLVLGHQSAALGGRRLADLFPVAERRPAQLRALFGQWQADPAQFEQQPPTLVFAVLGQAKADGQLTADQETRQLPSPGSRGGSCPAGAVVPAASRRAIPSAGARPAQYPQGRPSWRAGSRRSRPSAR